MELLLGEKFDFDDEDGDGEFEGEEIDDEELGEIASTVDNSKKLQRRRDRQCKRAKKKARRNRR